MIEDVDMQRVIEELAGQMASDQGLHKPDQRIYEQAKRLVQRDVGSAYKRQVLEEQ